MFPVLDPKKITRARGERSMQDIVDASCKAFSYEQLRSWERGDYRPNPENLKALLLALDVNYEDITTDYDMLMAQVA